MKKLKDNIEKENDGYTWWNRLIFTSLVKMTSWMIRTKISVLEEFVSHCSANLVSRLGSGMGLALAEK